METFKIQANASGTRSITVTSRHLQTIKKYSLLRNLIDSNGIIDESVLSKLRMNLRSMLESASELDKDLLMLCLDVIYDDNMKAFGLHKLVLLYIEWESRTAENDDKEGISNIENCKEESEVDE